MGIKDLSKVIGDHAPGAIKHNEMKSYFGRKVAIDASMSLYQFLIAVRQDGNLLQTDTGETTSHIMGMFYRTIRMIDNGLKPCFVFDGKPPDMKSGELEKRKEKRDEAEKLLSEAKEKGDTEAVDKFERRLVKVTKEQNEDVKKLLRLMGVPLVEAPCEAEAQCAALVKAGKVFATGTEDMDALTFGSNVLLRHLTFSEAKKMPIKEINLARILSDFDMPMEQFVDLCILLGCDYCSTIRGIGPKKAFELIKQHESIEAILENIDQKKYPVPEDWPYKRARELFLNPDVADASQLELVWKEPDVEGIVSFMCGEKNFNEDRVRSAVAKMQKGRTAASQGRIDMFFKSATIVKSEPTSAKRKAQEEKNKGGGKKRGPPVKRAKLMAKLIRLPHRALLKLKGPDNLSLLQGMVTNDVRKVTDDNSIAAFILNTKGRIVEDVLISRRQDDYLLECNAKSRGDVKQLLEKYRLRKQVEIAEVDDSVLYSSKPKGFVDPRTPALGYRVHGLEDEGNAPEEDYTMLRLSLGIAEGGVELHDLLPYQANGDCLSFVSLDKGCYIGQELTARTANTGVIRRRLLPFTTKEKTVSGEVVDEEGRKVGHTVASFGDRGIAMISLNAVARKLLVGDTEIRPFKPEWMSDKLYNHGDKK